MVDQQHLALTADNLVTILSDVDDKWTEIAKNLIIPGSEIIRIDQEQKTNKEKLQEIFKYAVSTHPYASWRLIIRSLDKAEAYEQADKIRKFAEVINGNYNYKVIL